MHFKKFLLSSASAALVLAASGQANAAGFYIQEQSVSGQGASFAGSGAQPRDASIQFFNPAGMTYLPGGNAHIGVTVLVPEADLSNTGTTLPVGAPASTGDGGNPYDPTPVPSAYISQQITDKLWLGLGISAPFGLSNDYDDGWFGRYDSTSTKLTTIDVTPSVAYKYSDWLSVGGSVIIQKASAELQKNLFGTSEGTQSLDGDDITAGFKVGVLAEPWQGTRLGAEYRSEIRHELSGRLIIRNTAGADANIVGNADLNLPDMASFSVAHDVNDRLTLLGSATWFGWNDFDEIQVTNIVGGNVGNAIVQNYQTSMAYSAGFDYKLNDAWTVRAGYQYDETPTTDEYRTTLTPDGDRHWFSAGSTYNWDDKWSFDLSGTYIHIQDQEVNLLRNTAANPSEVRADTGGDVIIFGASVNYKF